MRKSNLVCTFVLAALSTTCGWAQTGVPRIVVNAQGHSAKVQNLVFSAKGEHLISVSEDKTVRVWNTSTTEMLKKFESQIGDGWEGMLYASAISNDGKYLAVAGYPVSSEKENYIVIIDLEKGKQASTAIGHTNVINSLEFTSNGSWLISGSDDGTIKVWRMVPTGELTVITTIAAGGPVKSLSVNQKTLEVAAAVEGKSEVFIFNIAAIEKVAMKIAPRFWKKHKDPVNRVVYSADGSLLATSSMGKEFYVWKADGSVLKEFETSYSINAIAFSNDSRIVVGLGDGGNGVSYALPNGNKFTDFHGHDNTVFCATFAPSEDGSYVVASAGGNNNEILLWNPINGKTIRKIKGKGSGIQDLAFGQNMELYVSRELVQNKPAPFSQSFDFNNFSIGKAPAKPTLLKDFNSGLRLSSEVTLELPRGKFIQNDPNVDGRILDFQGTAEGTVVVASDYSLKMYDRGGLLLKEFVGHSGGVHALTISADGRYLASGGEDQSIILWKLSESGAAPSLRKAFPDDNWARFFSSLPIDSLTKEPSKAAWQEVISFLKANGDKTYRGIEEVYKNLGELVLPFATLFTTDDNDWVCWTPKGYFNCSSAGGRYFGWHVNRGIRKLADFYTAEQYFEILFRPVHMQKSMVQGKRIEEILKDEGERIFDLGRLHRPSEGVFGSYKLISSNQVTFKEGKFLTGARQLTLDVDLVDGGGGIKEVNIYHNDKLVFTDRDVVTKGEGEKAAKQYLVDLTNDLNEFKVVVVNYQKIESHPDVLQIEYTGQVIATSSLHLLVVGINKYMNSAYNLNYAQPDAKAFVDRLTDGTNNNIFKSIEKVEIYDELATKENIVKGFKAISARAKPEDVFVFFYAGHGSLDEEHKDKEGDAPFYFVPSDVTKLYGDPEQLQKKGFSGAELRDHLTQIRSTKQIVLMDACHSGGALKGMNVRAVASDEKAIVQLARSSGVVWIASSGTKQYATEFDVLQHGVFTYALLEALNGKADNGDNKITVNELKLFMEDRVPELTKQYGGQAQYPTGYIHGNDFPISVIDKK
ncbi:MAG: caspase family protein [Cyclobacteriaceae bacterium]|nr:caspase family protein [Cyclobacteriaceae bacterium]